MSKRSTVLRRAASVVAGVVLLMLASAATASAATRYTILAANDLGMHCMQKSYADFMVLPPANTLTVQVFRKGGEGARNITSGITVKYRVIGNTTSSTKIDFWQYAADYGFNLQNDVGVTGNGLRGTCVLSKDGKYWEATAIPVTPYLDSGTWTPYQTVRITVVSNTTNSILARTSDVVLPVSDEMRCDLCHGATHTAHDFLSMHDANEGTSLATDLDAGVRHACNECHADPILGAAGQPGVPSLSQAMHGFHAGRMGMVTLKNKCYACHPGPKTLCLRGAMAKAGITCTNGKCHGSMNNVALSQVAGRTPWLQEPDCRNCHGSKHASNKGTLYRNSYLRNGPEDMNGFIRCESCHNSTHAEWASKKAIDNKLPVSLQGSAGPIRKCSVCHSGSGRIHR